MPRHRLAPVVDLGQRVVVASALRARCSPGECSPPWPNGRRWWNSSPSLAVQRRPWSSTKRQRPPSRSYTARRTAAGTCRDARRVDPSRHLPRGLPRGLRPAEPLRLEPLELLGDGQFDDRGQVAIGHRRPHERLQALQLVAEPGPGGELDLVASGGEGLHARRPRPCGSHRGDVAGRVGELLRSLGQGLGRPPRASRRSGDDLPSTAFA